MANKTKILLVEDDKKFAASLMRLLIDEGFECVHAEKPQTAISLNKLHSFDIAIIDCMLPQMNGVDLSLKLKEGAGSSLEVYLMSGIYKDKNFSVSALKKTGAKSFLIKPFDVGELISQLKTSHAVQAPGASEVDSSIRGLYFQDSVSIAQIYKGIHLHPNITSLEVPLLIQCLSALKATCTINLTFEKSSFQFYFSEGRMMLNMPTYTSQQLRQFLNRKDFVIADDIYGLPENLFTLEKLQENGHISPHFTTQVEKDIAIQAMQSLRQTLNLTIESTPEIPPTRLLEFTPAEVDDFIYDWVLSTPLIWYKAFYVKHMTSPLRKMSTHQTKINQFPIIAANKETVALMMGNKIISDTMAEAKLDEETFYRLLHMLLIYREFHIGENRPISNHKGQIDRLRALMGTIELQNAYERLGLSANASDHDIKKSYVDLSQSLHPDKLIDAPEELLVLAKAVYQKIQDAYFQIKTPEKRQQYKAELENQKRENHLAALRYLDQAYNTLLRGDMGASEELLKQAEAMSPHFPRLKLYQAWVHLKTRRHPVQQISRSIQSLPQEEKDTATYYYVRGLISMASGEPDKAANFFQNTLIKDTDFMPARRELTTMPKAQKKNMNILTADLKDVVGLFFRKK